MSPAGKGTLKALLREALESVTIVQGGSGSLSIRDYRRAVQQYRARFDPALYFHVSRFDIQVGDSRVRWAILTLLRDELKPFLKEDRTFSASFAIVGGLGSGSSVEDILNNVVRSAIVFGPDQSALTFYDAVECGYITYQEYSLLTGIQIKKEITVLDGITLIPLPNDTSRLPGILPRMFDAGGIDFISKTLLRIDISVSPILHMPAQDYTWVSGPDRHFKRAIHSTDVTDFNPSQFIRALTLVGDHPVQSAMSWAHLDGEHIFNLSHGIGSGYSYSSVPTTNTPSTMFSEAGVRGAVDMYIKLVSLPTSTKQQLQIPLDRWMKSKTQQSYVDKMIDLGIAFESFFLRGIRDELSFRFRLRASLYLAHGIEQRRLLKNEFRQIYDIRSEAVHEGTVPERVRVDGQDVRMSEFLERSQELFKRSLLKVIEDGRLPDWDSIELGVGEETADDSCEPHESQAIGNDRD